MVGVRGEEGGREEGGGGGGGGGEGKKKTSKNGLNAMVIVEGANQSRYLRGLKCGKEPGGYAGKIFIIIIIIMVVDDSTIPISKLRGGGRFWAVGMGE